MDSPKSQLIDAASRNDLACFQASLVECVDQIELYQAARWGLHHFEDDAISLEKYVKPILEAMEDVNFLPKEEFFPLINLVIEYSPSEDQTHSLQLLELLLSKGANPNDSRHWPPLMHTIDSEGDAFNQAELPPKTDILKILLKYGANPRLTDGRNVGRTPLEIASNYRFQAAIEILEQHLRSEPSV